jgi:bacillithiol system protein YtxJ
MAIQWNIINSEQAVDLALQDSHTQTILIFKHSTTCPISGIAKMRLEGDWDLDSLPTYYIDVKSARPASLYLAETVDVRHESPQVIIVDKGEAIYDVSHLDISLAEVKDGLKELENNF